MSVEKFVTFGTKLMSPKATALYLWIGIPSVTLLLFGKMNSAPKLVSVGGITICFICQIMFLFFIAMTVNVMRKEEDMERLAIWKKVFLLSISVAPFCGLAFIQVNLFKKLIGS